MSKSHPVCANLMVNVCSIQKITGKPGYMEQNPLMVVHSGFIRVSEVTDPFHQ